VLGRLLSEPTFLLVAAGASASLPLAWAMAVVAVLLGGSSWFWLRRGRVAAGVVASAAAFGTLLIAYVWFIVPALEPSRSQRPLAELARRVCPPPGVIGFYGREDHQVTFYVGRPVRWLSSREELYAMLGRPEPAFVIADYKRFKDRQEERPDLDMRIIADNRSNRAGKHEHPMVLVTNKAGWQLAAKTLNREPEK
jgi:hypothetical protein